jgi:hypothetical protein
MLASVQCRHCNSRVCPHLPCAEVESSVADGDADAAAEHGRLAVRCGQQATDTRDTYDGSILRHHVCWLRIWLVHMQHAHPKHVDHAAHRQSQLLPVTRILLLRCQSHCTLFQNRLITVAYI